MTTKAVSSIKYQVSGMVDRFHTRSKKYLISDTKHLIPRDNDGDTLIEVIIGVVIIGTVLLSAYTLSTRAFKLGLSSRERAQAAQLVQTQAEALQALRNSNDWDDFASLIPPPGSEFHVLQNGANQWEISRSRLNNPVINGKSSIYSDIWITGNLTGPDPANPDKFEGTINIEWPRIGGGDEVSSVPFKLTDRNIPLANLTLDPAQAPEADFTGSPRSGIGSLTVKFQDQSTNNPTSWEWDFGDGGSSTAQNPTHTYNSPGSYTVKLTATGIGGSGTRTKRDYITVYESVQADFTATPLTGTEDLSVRFADSSTGDISSWQWDFGDGGTSTSPNPTHVYRNGGQFTVTLDVSGLGGTDQESKSRYIKVEGCGNGTDDDGDGSINESCPTKITFCGGPWGIGVGQRLTCNLGAQRLVHHVYISAGCNDGERGRFELRFDDGTVRRYNAGCNTLINIPDEVTQRIRLRMLSGGGSDNFISWSCCGSGAWRAYWR